MAAGKASALAVHVAIREVLEEPREETVVSPGDAVALSETVQRLPEGVAGRARMGATAPGSVDARLNRDDQTEPLVGLLEVDREGGGRTA